MKVLLKRPFLWSLLLCATFATSANASFLLGQEVRLGHDSNQAYVPQTTIVNSAIEFQNQYFRVDIDDTSLSVTFLQSVLYNPSGQGFNGFRLEDNFSYSVPDFAAASIQSGTTFAGFTNDRITVLPDLLKLNFANLTPELGSVIHVRITPVPEPAQFLLLAAGLGLLRSRLRQRSAA